MRLVGLRAIVTGAASGFGKGIAQGFAAEGASVLVADVDGAKAIETATAIGPVAHACQVDVSKASEVDAMVEKACDALGGIDILVNNAGVTHCNQPALDVSEDEFDHVFSVNVKSIFLTAKAVVPQMQAGGGAIINIASTAAQRPRAGLSWYNGSKGAALTLTKSLAVEFAPFGIRVNAINPVIGETGLLERFMGREDTQENRESFVAGIPLGRMSRPTDVANAAIFLADPASAFITGTAIDVDGGRSI